MPLTYFCNPDFLYRTKLLRVKVFLLSVKALFVFLFVGKCHSQNNENYVSLWTWKSCWSTKTFKKTFISVSTTAVNKAVLWKKKWEMFWCEVRCHLSCFEAPRGVFDNITEQCFYEWAPVLFCAHGHAHARAFKWHGMPSCQWIHTIPLSYRWWSQPSDTTLPRQSKVMDVNKAAFKI